MNLLACLRCGWNVAEMSPAPVFDEAKEGYVCWFCVANERDRLKKALVDLLDEVDALHVVEAPPSGHDNCAALCLAAGFARAALGGVK